MNFKEKISKIKEKYAPKIAQIIEKRSEVVDKKLKKHKENSLNKKKNLEEKYENLIAQNQDEQKLKEIESKKLEVLERHKLRTFRKTKAIEHDNWWWYNFFIRRFENTRKTFNFSEFEKNVLFEDFQGKLPALKVVAEIKDLSLSFLNPSNPGEKNIVLRNTSIKFYEGKIHAIIGESGSGKSVITSLLFGLTGQNAVFDAGKVMLFNHEVQDFDFTDWEKSNYRGKVISAVFQNPMSTLNPTMKIGKQIMEGILINGIAQTKKQAYEIALHYLSLTKINQPEKIMKLYPHELSGGMIQRVVIASIVALKPKIIVMDEPTTALDPAVQALVLDVIRELQKELKITIIFITHDLGVVASIANYISIMYAGQIIEEGSRDEILNFPQHPYTWGLIGSMPDVNNSERLTTIRGSVPSSLNKIKGDAFAVRNDYALERDFEIEPDFYFLSPTHRAKTALLDPRAEKIEPPKLILEKWNKWKAQEDANETINK